MIVDRKKIVITGGTSGIGYELVKQLHSNNEVIVIARDQAKLCQLKENFKNIKIYSADLSNLQEVNEVADRILCEYDCLDMLINNAAMQQTTTFDCSEFDYESISREITLNFTAVCSLCYLLLPRLIHESQAVILNINSGLGLVAKKSSAIYCGTKGGLNIFSHSLRHQLAETNVDVFQTFLGLVDTAMTTGRGKNKLAPEKAAAMIIQGVRGNVLDQDIGKVKLLRLLSRFLPAVARLIMKQQ